MQQRIKIPWRLVAGSLCFLGILFGEIQDVNAAAKVRDFSAYLNKKVQIDTEGANWKIYAGYAGATVGGVGNSDGTYNSCAALTTAPNGVAYTCNRNGVLPSTSLTVTVSSNDAASYPNNCFGNLIKGYINNTQVNVVSSSHSSAAKDSTVTATLLWSDICAAMGNAGCTSSKSGTLTLGFDKDCSSPTTPPAEKVTVQIAFRYVQESPLQAGGQTRACDGSFSIYSGFCDYTVYPGDEKVYVDTAAYDVSNLTAEDLNGANGVSGTGLPDPSAMKIDRLRVYYSTSGGFASINPANSPYKDLVVSGTSLSDRKITGLVNDQNYVFLAANVDEAGNEHYFFDTTTLDATDGEQSATGIGTTQSATPQEVYGLLDNKKCFIATAAYGSGNYEGVRTLRSFRDHFLVNWSGGQWFIRTYYKYSPPIAEFISEREWLKSVIRAGLSPVVVIAASMLKFGFIGLVMMFFAAAGIFFLGIKMIQARGAKK